MTDLKRIAAVLLLGLGSCASSKSAPRENLPETPVVLARRLELLRLTGTDGSSLDLRGDLEAGREVGLVFWQSWCAPCRREAPRVDQVARTRRDLRIVGVVSGPDGAVDERAVAAFVRDLDLSYPQVRDRDAALATHFAVSGTPTIVWLARDGSIRYRGHEIPQAWLAP